MPYRTDIPGQVSVHQLKAIEVVARLVPKGGHVVEVGSLFGRSSYAWAASVDPSVTVHCIDPWEANVGIRSMEERHGVTYSREQFLRFMDGLTNVEAHEGYSPADFEGWDRPVDLYYEDAVHVDPGLSANLDFWTGKLAPGGIVCGDDYRPRFADVRHGAERLAERLGRELVTVEHFWCLLPPDHPGTPSATEALSALAAEAERDFARQRLKLRVGPRADVRQDDPESELTAKGRCYIEAPERWAPAGGDRLFCAVRLVSEAGDRDEAVVMAPLPTDALLYDQPVDFDLRVPPGLVPLGTYRLVFDLFAFGSGWQTDQDVATLTAMSVRFGARSAGGEGGTDDQDQAGRRAGVLSRLVGVLRLATSDLEAGDEGRGATAPGVLIPSGEGAARRVAGQDAHDALLLVDAAPAGGEPGRLVVTIGEEARAPRAVRRHRREIAYALRGEEARGPLAVRIDARDGDAEVFGARTIPLIVTDG